MSARRLVRGQRQQPRPPVASAPASEPPTPAERTSKPQARQYLGMAKLTDDEVRAIRADYVAGRWGRKDLADIYGVTPCTISNVVSWRSYSHVIPLPEQQES